MNNQDFERLKALCEKEGFELELSSPWDQTYRISKKDPWQGVEFVEVIEDGCNVKKGKIYKVIGKSKKGLLGYLPSYYQVSEDMHVSEAILKPSTEQAYIEQLKKEAFERFGDINIENITLLDNSELDMFTIITKNEWVYDKKKDSLHYWGYCIYKSGKWATRVPERVKVNWFRVGKSQLVIDLSNEVELGVLLGLASQLEKYLNGEVD